MSSGITTKTYVVVWGWLAGLMLLGVLVSGLPISHRMVVGVVLGLSTVKAILIASYFMHLRIDSRFFTWIATIPIPFGLVLLIVLLLDKPGIR